VTHITEELLSRSSRQNSLIHDLVFVPNLEIVFCFISKNASSFLKHFIFLAAKGILYKQPRENPHLLHQSFFRGIDSLGHAGMSRLIESPSIPKVILGRDPWFRLQSAYFSRVVRWQEESYDPVDDRRDWFALRQEILGYRDGCHGTEPLSAAAAGVGFEALVDYVSATPSGMLDRHLIPQTYFSATDLIQYSVVGNLEDLPTFIALLSSTTGFQLNLPPRSESSLNASSSEKMGPPKTKALFSRIVERYSSDYEFFGYDKSGL
jgi:hypothetical protein